MPPSTSDFGAQRFATGAAYRVAGVVREVDGALVAIEGGGGTGLAKRARVVTQSVCDRYYFASPAQLNWRQHEAANMILATWSRAKLDGIRTTKLDGLSGGGGPGLTDAMIEASRRYAEIKRHLGDLERVIYHVCLGNISAREFGEREGMGRTDGMGVLRYALTALANYYGLPDRKDRKS